MPKVAFNSPPSVSPRRFDISSVAKDRTAAKGIMARKFRVKTAVGSHFSIPAMIPMGTKTRRILTGLLSRVTLATLNTRAVHRTKKLSLSMPGVCFRSKKTCRRKEARVSSRVWYPSSGLSSSMIWPLFCAPAGPVQVLRSFRRKSTTAVESVNQMMPMPKRCYIQLFG